MTRRTKGKRRLCMTRRQWRERALAAEHGQGAADHELRGALLRIVLLEDQLARRDETDRARLAQKTADGVDVGVLQKQLEAAEKANGELTAKHLATVAMLQNATAIDVPPMHRDTSDSGDQPTEAIYVQTLRDHMAKQGSPVKPLAEALGGVA